MTATNHNWSQAGIINKFLPWYVHSHWTRWIELKMKWANTYLPYRNLYQCNIDLSLLSLTDGPPLSWIIICPLMTNLSPILIVLQRTICIQNAVTGSFYQQNKLFFTVLLYFYVDTLKYFALSSFLTVSPKVLNLVKWMLSAWVVSSVALLLTPHNGAVASLSLRWWKYWEENVPAELRSPESIEPTVPDPSQINLRFNFIDCFKRGSAYIQSHEIKTFPKLFIR